MKKIVKSLGIACCIFITTFIFASCNSDDGYSLGDMYVSFATLKKSDSAFYLEADSGAKLWVAAPNWNTSSLKEGQRIHINFTILSDGDNDYDHYIKLNDMSLIETLVTQDIQTEEDNEKYKGDDPLPLITDNEGELQLWVNKTKTHLSLFYGVYADQMDLYLVKNNLVENADDSNLYLELRCNANGASVGNTFGRIVSFYLPEDMLVDKTHLKIKRVNKEGSVEELEVPLESNPKVITSNVH